VVLETYSSKTFLRNILSLKGIFFIFIDQFKQEDNAKIDLKFSMADIILT